MGDRLGIQVAVDILLVFKTESITNSRYPIGLWQARVLGDGAHRLLPSLQDQSVVSFTRWMKTRHIDHVEHVEHVEHVDLGLSFKTDIIPNSRYPIGLWQARVLGDGAHRFLWSLQDQSVVSFTRWMKTRLAPRSNSNTDVEHVEHVEREAYFLNRRYWQGLYSGENSQYLYSKKLS